MSERLLIIAEAGVNHNGSIDRALEMVGVAVEAGADIIKFQTFSADKLVRKDAQLAEYQRTSETDSRNQWDLLKGLELSHEEFTRIRAYCDERGIEFLSPGFDLNELAFLIDELSIPIVKVASGDLTFAPMLVAAGLSGLRVILSTGMANLDEVGQALRFINVGIAQEAGLLASDTAPSRDVLETTWTNAAVRQLLADRVTVLHCTTEYPAPLEVLNLQAICTIASEFGVPVGYSDHSLGDLASIVAVGLGATVIEKHFTLDKSLEGPDHAASLDAGELVDFVRRLREVEVVLGSPVKECQPVEVSNRAAVRRSIVASRPIAAGDLITESDLECQRPGVGRSAFEFWDVVGSRTPRDYVIGEYVD